MQRELRQSTLIRAVRWATKRFDSIESLLHSVLTNERAIMSTFEDLKAAQDATDAKVAKIKSDVEAMLAKSGSLTPEQQAALDAGVTQATAANVALDAVDAALNPATPAS